MDAVQFVERFKGKIKGNATSWIVIVICVCSSVYMEVFAEPATRPFSLTDPAISNPFVRYEKYNDVWMLVVSVILPLVVISTIIMLDPRTKEKFQCFYESSLDFSLTISFTMFLTTFLKIRLTKLRPDFLARCGAVVTSLNPVNLSDISVCTAPLGKRILADGFKSCPSGHSSMSASGLGFVSLWILKTYWSRFNVKTAVIALCFFPILLVLDVATSRVSDFKHSYTDILTGLSVGVIGLVLGQLCDFEQPPNSTVLPV